MARRGWSRNPLSVSVRRPTWEAVMPKCRWIGGAHVANICQARLRVGVDVDFALQARTERSKSDGVSGNNNVDWFFSFLFLQNSLYMVALCGSRRAKHDNKHH